MDPVCIGKAVFEKQYAYAAKETGIQELIVGLVSTVRLYQPLIF